jgi:CelD/BcsL family acetyltransferase involved in cellulose biosynthesis
MVAIEELSASDERWVSFCADRSDVTLFQSPEWSEIVRETYDFSLRVLLATEGRTVVGGLPFAHIEDFRGPRRVALAFADNLEPLPASLWHEFERYLAADALPWTIRTLCKPSDAAHSSKVVAQHHAVHLPPTFAEAEAAFNIKHKQKWRQAVRGGVTHRVDTSLDGLRLFYQLHTETRKFKHGLMPQPLAFFEAIHRRFFPQNGFLLIAEHEGAPIAVMFFLAYGSTLYYKFSASSLSSLPLRPNNLLITKVIEMAIERGYKKLDLGISDTEGLIGFKERIGGRASDVYSAVYNPREKSTAVSEVERAFGEITKVLTAEDVPSVYAQRGGEILYRFFT